MHPGWYLIIAIGVMLIIGVIISAIDDHNNPPGPGGPVQWM
jgi:hypothetical protein